MCASFGNISVLMTPILPKIFKYLYLLFLATFCIFYKALSKFISISSEFWSKSNPSMVNLVRHFRPKDPAMLDLSRLLPNSDSIVLVLLTSKPDNTKSSSYTFKRLFMFNALRSSSPSTYSRKRVRSSA